MLMTDLILALAAVVALVGTIAIALIVRRQTAGSPPAFAVSAPGGAERARLPDVSASVDGAPTAVELTVIFRNSSNTGAIVLDPAQDVLHLIQSGSALKVAWQAAGLTNRTSIGPYGGELKLIFPTAGLPAAPKAGDQLALAMIELGVKTSLAVPVS